jgi:hypothetical protein
MNTDGLWQWLGLGLLGAYHGVNPAMGWLFAVALGLQEGRRAAVLRALPPIALGHEASIALVAVLVGGLQLVADPTGLRLVSASGLILFGLFKLVRPRAHPRWVGMRVTGRDLFVWSFLMSGAHGAGLMLVPLLLGHPGESHEHALPAIGAATLAANTLAVFVHTAAMLAFMGLVALVVYETVGVGVLRRAWVNLDALWAVAVMAAGAVTLFT